MAGAKIVLDTYHGQKEQWCWRTEWHVHGESAWTLLSKFAQLNQLTARELAALITNKTSGRRTSICNKPDVDLRDASAFDLDVLGQVFRMPASRIARGFLYEILPGSVLRSHEHLRWCVQCLHRGFHSPLFQMRLTRACPIHECPLRESCPSCARPIPYRLNNPFALKPFHCPHCDVNFAPPMNSERPALMRLRQEHIAQLAALLRFYRAADVDLVHVDDADRLFINAKRAGIFHVDVEEVGVQCRYASFIAQVVHEVAPGLYRRQGGLRFEPVMRYTCGCWRPILSDDDEEVSVEFDTSSPSAKSPIVASEACLAAIVNTYKAVRRQLWHRVLRKHRRCIRSAADRMWWRMDGERTSGFCPHALAFIRWRMLWEGCGTPRYLFTRRTQLYYGIIGWHLARPCPAPAHWSVPTKAWIAAHIFGATCLSAFEEMLRLAESSCKQDLVHWDREKSPIDYTCLWAVAGRDCSDRPASVYVRSTSPARSGLPQVENCATHWLRHRADIQRLQR